MIPKIDKKFYCHLKILFDLHWAQIFELNIFCCTQIQQRLCELDSNFNLKQFFWAFYILFTNQLKCNKYAYDYEN